MRCGATAGWYQWTSAYTGLPGSSGSPVPAVGVSSSRANRESTHHTQAAATANVASTSRRVAAIRGRRGSAVRAAVDRPHHRCAIKGFCPPSVHPGQPSQAQSTTCEGQGDEAAGPLPAPLGLGGALGDELGAGRAQAGGDDGDQEQQAGAAAASMLPPMRHGVVWKQDDEQRGGGGRGTPAGCGGGGQRQGH